MNLFVIRDFLDVKRLVYVEGSIIVSKKARQQVGFLDNERIMSFKTQEHHENDVW